VRRIDPQLRVCLPDAVMKKLRLAPGDLVGMSIKNGVVRIHKLKVVRS
jgi:antitoxin component of MazEF toxin-antitoxin module